MESRQLWSRRFLLLVALVVAAQTWPIATANAGQPSRCVLQATFDQDADGGRRATELPAADVEAAVTDANGRRFELLTGEDGSTEVPGTAEFPIRVDFIAPRGRELGPAGTDFGLSSQFIDAATDCGQGTRGWVGVYDPQNYCSRNPDLVTSCFVVADVPDHDQSTAIVALRNDTVDNGSGDGLSPEDWLSEGYRTMATVGEVGAVHGLDVAADGTTYAAAFVKESTRLQSSLNPEGNPTAIYVVAPGAGPELLVEVDPSATDPRSGANQGLPGSVFTTGLGDIQLSANEETLFAVNLGSRTLVEIDVAAAEVTRSIPLDAAALGVEDCAVDSTEPFGDLRPFGLGLGPNENLLVGVVCSGESTVSASDFPVDGPAPGNPAGENAALVGRVFDYDGQAFTERLTFSLSGDRGRMQSGGGVSHDAAWHPWVDVYPFDAEFDAVAYPQPAITDLSLGPDGGLVVAIGDRWGHQTAPLAEMIAWDGGSRSLAEPLVAGDLRVACAAGAGWVIEGTAGCRDDTSEHFQDDRYGIHDETALGSVVHLPDSGEIVATHMDPVQGDNTWRSGGLVWHNIDSGRSRKGIRVYDGRNASPDATFEKAAGLGGLAVGCGGRPLQIGGHIWHDVNADGIHAPSERPISNVIVGLYDRRGKQLGTTTTDAQGGYYFDTPSVRLEEGTIYRVGIEPTNTDFGRSLSPAGDFFGLAARNAQNRTAEEDDKAVYVDDEPVAVRLPSVQVVAGVDATVMHNADFGLVDNYDLHIELSNFVLDLENQRSEVQLVVTNRGSFDSGETEVTVSIPRGFWPSLITSGDTRAADDGTATWTARTGDELRPGEQATYVIHLDATEALAAERLELSPSVRSVERNERFDGDPVIFGVGEIGGSISVEGQQAPVDLTIELVNRADRVVSTTQTDARGFYSFPYLVPGDYRVRIPAEAFAVDGRIGQGFVVKVDDRDDIDPSADSVLSAMVRIDGSSPTGESIESPSGTVDSASDLTVDFHARSPTEKRYLTWRGIVPAVVFGSLLLWFLLRQLRKLGRRR